MTRTTFTPSDEALSFVLKASAVRTGIRADNGIIASMRQHVADAVLGLCCTISDSLTYALDRESEHPEKRYPLTNEQGQFRETLLPALALRMHCLPEDFNPFSKALGRDFCNFLREHGGCYTIVNGVELRLHEGTAYIYGANKERHRAYHEPLEKRVRARVVKFVPKQ